MGIDPNKLNPHFRALIEATAREVHADGAMMNQEPTPEPLAQTEADHQNRFIGVCKARGWAYVWHNTKKRSTGTVGTPDVIVAARSKVFWIEFKLPAEKLSPDQVVFAKQLAANGCQVHVLYSAEQAVALIENAG